MSLAGVAFVMIAVLVRWATALRPLHRRASTRSTTRASRRPSRVDDGVDFVPTRPFYLLGQHFSAIAAAGPDRRADPRLPCSSAGCRACSGSASASSSSAPCTTSRSLVASVRHGGALDRRDRQARRSGARAWLAIMLFIWIALVYVIVAFTDITASTFVGGGEELDGVRVRASTPAARSPSASVAVPRARAS